MSVELAIGLPLLVAGFAFAAWAGGRQGVVQALVAGVLPAAAALAFDPALAVFPLAAAGLEVGALTRLLRTRQPLIEAWLCAGARPLEILPRIRSRARPAIVVALLLLLPVLVKPAGFRPAPHVVALFAIGAASLAASILLALRSFVDGRLVDRPPAESRSPFRLRPYEAPPTPRVYEARPGRERSRPP